MYLCRKEQKEPKTQNVYIYALCLLLFHPVITSFLIIVGIVVFGNSTYMAAFGYILLFGMIFITLIFSLQRWNVDAIVLFTILLFEYFISYLFFPLRRSIIFTSVFDVLSNPFYYLFIYSFPGYVFARKIVDYDKMIEIFGNFSVMVILISVVIFIFWNNAGVPPQYLEFSYNLLLPTTFLILSFLKSKKFFRFIVGLVGLFLILFAGGRGAVVSFAFSIIVYLFINQLSSIRKFIVIFLLVFLSIIVYLKFEIVVNQLLIVADRLGINSRTVRMIQTAQFFDDSGRFAIIQKNMENFTFFGLGMYGDRFIIGNHFTSYAHNLFIELLTQYGYLFGIILITFILFLIGASVFIKNRAFKLITISLLSTGFFKLQFSSSYLSIEPAFYALLGFGINSLVMRGKIVAHKNSVKD